MSANETDSLIGFQPEDILLTRMEDAVVKLIFIGDGMSGKTQILIKIAQLLKEYLQQICSLSTETDQSDLHRWAERRGFFLRYGDVRWDIKTVSLDTETVGLEDFEYVFPYQWNDTTYKIRLIGNDVGGQNIFDHFRDVLAKMAGPDDNLVVVFDKSRELSCYNSIEHVKRVLGIMKSENESNLSRIVYCGNKIDLEKHIQNEEWREGILNSIMRKLNDITNHGKAEYSFPSLMDTDLDEQQVKVEAKDNQVTFPDLEAIIYNAIREFDTKYKTDLMSEVNTKALCREIAAQLVYNQKVTNLEEGSTEAEQVWEDLRTLLYQTRPLAIQYSVGGRIKHQNGEPAHLSRVRDKWFEFGLNLPITSEYTKFALRRTANAEELLAEMGDRFNTNALSGAGVLKMLDFIIQETLKILKGPNQKERRAKRELKRF
jgi:GTPase SAR1 family protein